MKFPKATKFISLLWLLGQLSKDEYLTHGDVRVDLFKRLVLDCYDVMHTQSLKHVSEDLVEALSNWEKQHKFNR